MPAGSRVVCILPDSVRNYMTKPGVDNMGSQCPDFVEIQGEVVIRPETCVAIRLESCVAIRLESCVAIRSITRKIFVRERLL